MFGFAPHINLTCLQTMQRICSKIPNAHSSSDPCQSRSWHWFFYCFYNCNSLTSIILWDFALASWQCELLFGYFAVTRTYVFKLQTAIFATYIRYNVPMYISWWERYTSLRLTKIAYSPFPYTVIWYVSFCTVSLWLTANTCSKHITKKVHMAKKSGIHIS